MASMTCNYFSTTLKRNVSINVIIPTPEGNEQITNEKTVKSYHYKAGLKVLYLLHGAFGNYSSWLRFSNIERYAQKHCIAVVMASADNSFYQDMKHGGSYHSFFTKELPAFVTNIFPVSNKRENTYIAGLSMGGYGAWFLALSNPELYSKAASLSGAVDIKGVYDGIKSDEMSGPFEWENIFEETDKLAGSKYDLMALYKSCQKNNNAPKLYQACGTEDFLYNSNLEIKNQLEAMNAELFYEEGQGGHDWDFWDKYIQNVLEWILE